MPTFLHRFVPLALVAAASIAVAQEKPAEASPERARANFARPIELASDDVRRVQLQDILST
jgi:hypothetical protein